MRYLILTSCGLAFDSIRAHKLRSFLTLLGVIIGVSSVVLVGAAINGLGVYAEQSTAKAFGSDSYLLAQVVGEGDRKKFQEALKRNKPIRQDDVTYLRLVTGDNILYTPYDQRAEDVKAEGNIYEAASILGVSSTLAEVRDVAVVDGRFFTDQEERTKQPVCVIGDEIRTSLFPNVTPLGRTLKMAGLTFTVIGVQEKLGSAFGRNQDNSLYIPYTVYTRLFGTGKSIAVFGRAKPDTHLSLEAALDITRVALRTRFKARPGQPDNFDTLTPDSIRSFIGNILGLIAAVVVPVTGISLVVGGIVIMNIMLVSVTERTREIGVRKAIGARRTDIMTQFLIEAILMSAFGGVIGVALGAAATKLISLAAGLSLAITPGYVILSLFVSSAVGIISGWYPASRAAKLDPVEALRAE